MFTALPNNAVIVATIDDRTRWIDRDAEIRAYMNDRETREIDSLMRERRSVCG